MTEDSGPVSQKNRKLLFVLSIVAVLMFAFAVFYMPTLYRVFCEVTGLNGGIDVSSPGGRVAVEDFQIDESVKIDTSRIITVQFVSDSDPALPWVIKPETNQVKVHPGEVKKVVFFAKNNSGRKIVARSVPSVTPGLAAGYLKKTQCFCFDEMTLEGYQEEDMPVVFHLQTDLPEDISTVTLAYKSFNISDPEAAQTVPEHVHEHEM
ncbi:MAG: cytochrome c oxidase assembly protein [Pseudomonadales bacterium]|nr:cytochrome c oxidase assembly protein [Pseudomonadales bacterium]